MPILRFNSRLALLLGLVFAAWIAVGIHRIVQERRERRLAQEQFAATNRLPGDIDEVLDRGDPFILYSLDPNGKWIGVAGRIGEVLDVDDKTTFHGWPILGQAEIRDEKERRELLVSLRKGMKESVGTQVLCFKPRHGIRAVHAGRTIDLVICFECLQVEVIEGSNRIAGLLTTDLPAAAFNATLKKAGLPLAP